MFFAFLREKDVFYLYEQVKRNKSETELIELIKSGRLSVNSLNKEKKTPLMHAIDLEFSKDCVKKLVELGSDVNAQDAEGMTSLHFSFYTDNHDLFDYLLNEAKADPKIEENDGNSIINECKDEAGRFLEILQSSTNLGVSIYSEEESWETYDKIWEKHEIISVKKVPFN